MKKYVVGFCFSEDLKTVWLIRKKRPAWQAGRLNGVGGHIETGESPHQAMEREFVEETGCALLGWDNFATLEHKEQWKVYFFRYIISKNHPCQPLTVTDEAVIPIKVKGLHPAMEMAQHLEWLIPMAIETPKGVRYEIKEHEEK